MAGMSEIEIEQESTMSREEAAALLRRIADALARHNQVDVVREGRRLSVSVPDTVTVEVEVELEAGGGSLEVELSW